MSPLTLLGTNVPAVMTDLAHKLTKFEDFPAFFAAAQCSHIHRLIGMT